MNSPLFYWNIPRIPVATTFLFWWCATLVKFGWEVAPQRFLFERAKSLAGRSRHLVSIFNRNPCLTLRSRHLTSFFGQKSDFRAIEGEEGLATCFAMSFFAPYKEAHASMHASKTRAKRENSRLPTDTAPAPFSPSLMGRGYYPCRCHEKVKILKGMYSKWGCPYSQKLPFQI